MKNTIKRYQITILNKNSECENTYDIKTKYFATEKQALKFLNKDLVVIDAKNNEVYLREITLPYDEIHKENYNSYYDLEYLISEFKDAKMDVKERYSRLICSWNILEGEFYWHRGGPHSYVKGIY